MVAFIFSFVCVLKTQATVKSNKIKKKNKKEK